MLSHGHDFWRIALWQVGSWSYWAVAASWIVRLAEGAPLPRLGGLGVLVVLLHLPIKALLLVGLHPYTPVDEYSFGQARLVSLPYALISDPGVYTLLVVTGRAIASTRRAHEVEVRESHLAAELSRAQLEALRLEIEPHFLSNTLNSIAALIRIKDNAAALRMLVQLSELMRSTLVTAFRQYAADAFDVLAIDYLLKPFSDERR